jgi:glycosyltransferase involved in cell wall biosynthesis
MNVCMIIFNYWPGPQGGTEHQCRLLSNALHQRGVMCTVLTSHSTRGLAWRENDAGVRIVRMPTLDGLWRRPNEDKGHQVTPAIGARSAKGEGRQPLSAVAMVYLNALFFQLASTLFLWRHRRRFDVLHVHTSEWIAGFAVWIGARLQLPVICKVATLPVMRPLDRAIPFRRSLARLRTRCEFMAQNEAQAEDLRSTGIGAARIRVIPNSVTIPDVSPREPNGNLVLFVGNLTQMNAHKAFDVLFDGWAELASRCPEARLVVVGAGEPSEWEARLEERNARASVDFVGRVDDVDDYYRRAAVFVLPSRQEGLSNALLESQSWGVPAVVSDIPGNVGVVTHGENGLVVPVNDVRALADGIEMLLKDNAKRDAMGRKARERMERGFNIAGIAETVESTYECLVADAVT